MMRVDDVLSVLAPHVCLGCGVGGSVLCGACLVNAGEPPPPRCAGCKKLTAGYRTCSTCRSWLGLHSVYVATIYEGLYEQLVRAYKFDVRRQAAEPIAQMMQHVTPLFSEDNVLLCLLPTAPARIRQRGFDHGKLLARTYWRGLPRTAQQQIEYSEVLGRKSNVRQLGSGRAQRIRQMEDEFYVKDGSKVKGQTCLLIDDVTTTGASLAAAARILKAAGAARVYGVVFGQKV